jgi:hypothetical protein
MFQVVIDDLKQDSYLFAHLSTMKTAADMLREYLARRDNPEVAAAFLKENGFSWIDIPELPKGEILYCCLWDGEEERGVYKMDSNVVAELDLTVGMPCDPKWSIQGFLDSFP